MEERILKLITFLSNKNSPRDEIESLLQAFENGSVVTTSVNLHDVIYSKIELFKHNDKPTDETLERLIKNLFDYELASSYYHEVVNESIIPREFFEKSVIFFKDYFYSEDRKLTSEMNNFIIRILEYISGVDKFEDKFDEVNKYIYIDAFDLYVYKYDYPYGNRFHYSIS